MGFEGLIELCDFSARFWFWEARKETKNALFLELTKWGTFTLSLLEGWFFFLAEFSFWGFGILKYEFKKYSHASLIINITLF